MYAMNKKTSITTNMYDLFRYNCVFVTFNLITYVLYH